MYQFLQQLWFVLIAVLWVGYFVLEGFDFGVGALLRLIGKDEPGQRVLINTIGPVWDGNEVWLLTAGGATFAAFPEWYATLFSGFYLPLLLILVCLIIRGVAFEYRGKGTTDTWRRNWDWAIMISSWVPALLWGVAFGNIVRGVPIDIHHEYVGGFFNLLNPFALVMGITTLLLFLTHGSVFLSLKTSGEVRLRAQAMAVRLGPFAVLAMAVALGWQQALSGNWVSGLVALVAVLALAAGWQATRAERDGWAFVATAASTLTLVVSWFSALHPNVMPSSLNKDYSLTIVNASSSQYTLTVMSWVALCLVPFVLGYQAWSYWVFRRRLSTADIPALPTSADRPASVA